MKSIIKNRELRNSRELIQFLELNKFCPEFLINPPLLIYQEMSKTGFYIRLFTFIAKHNLFITVSNNKKTMKSAIKIYSFKIPDMVEDSYLLK